MQAAGTTTLAVITQLQPITVIFTTAEDIRQSADPDATIEVRDETVPVRASTAEGEERDHLWALMTEVWPAYDEYQAKTEREIPVVVLSRR